jgi:hypothetical protein
LAVELVEETSGSTGLFPLLVLLEGVVGLTQTPQAVIRSLETGDERGVLEDRAASKGEGHYSTPRGTTD